MITGDHGDDRGGVPGLHERVVVGTHLGETLGVLVDERGLGNGVRTGEVLVNEERVFVVGLAHTLGLAGGVVGPVGGHGGVADGEEEDLDGVRETNVVGLVGVLERVEGLDGGGLHLLNQNVTRSTGHALPLVVGDNGIVGPHLHGGELGKGGAEIGEDGDTGDDNGLVGIQEGDVVPRNQELVVVADAELDAHVVVGKGGRRKSHTRVPGVEKGKGKIEGLLGEGLARSDEVISHTHHVQVTNLLTGRSGESSPEIKLVVIKTGSHKIVESNGRLADKIVHKIGSPRHKGINGHITTILLASKCWYSGHRGKNQSHPGVEKIITGTRNGHGPFLRESRSARSTRKNDGDLREPCRFTRLPDEICGGVITSVHVFFKLVISSEIYKP